MTEEEITLRAREAVARYYERSGYAKDARQFRDGRKDTETVIERAKDAIRVAVEEGEFAPDRRTAKEMILRTLKAAGNGKPAKIEPDKLEELISELAKIIRDDSRKALGLSPIEEEEE